MRKWLWWILGAALVVLAFGTLEVKPAAVLAEPANQALATTTPLIVDSPGSNNYSAGVVMGVVATPGAAGTPGIYAPLPMSGNGIAVAMAGQIVAARSTVVLPVGTPVATYTAGDVVTSATPAALTFTNACRVNGGSGYVVAADLATDQAANTASYRLWLYQSPPPVLVADNAANTLLYTNNAIRVGYIDLPAASTNAGSNTAAYSQVPDSRLAYVCAANSTSLAGVLQTQSAFTQASAQGYDAGLKLMPN